MPLSITIMRTTCCCCGKIQEATFYDNFTFLLNHTYQDFDLPNTFVKHSHFIIVYPVDWVITYCELLSLIPLLPVFARLTLKSHIGVNQKIEKVEKLQTKHICQRGKPMRWVSNKKCKLSHKLPWQNLQVWHILLWAQWVF